MNFAENPDNLRLLAPGKREVYEHTHTHGSVASV